MYRQASGRRSRERSQPCNVLRLGPAPAGELRAYSFTIRLREPWGVAVDVTSETVSVSLPASERFPLQFAVGRRLVTPQPGETRTLERGADGP